MMPIEIHPDTLIMLDDALDEIGIDTAYDEAITRLIMAFSRLTDAQKNRIISMGGTRHV